MVKPKKKRKGDAVQVAHSVMQDVFRLADSGSGTAKDPYTFNFRVARKKRKKTN